MKKTLIMPLAVVTLVVAGGSYMMLATDKDQNLVQYLPESIAGLFTDNSEEVLVETLESDTQINEVSDQADLTFKESTVTTAIELEDNKIDQPDVMKGTMSEDIVDSNNDSIEPEKVIEPSPEKTNIPTDVVNLEKELVEKNTLISKLDEENKQLETKFKQMLKEHNDLAVKLDQMDNEINTSN